MSTHMSPSDDKSNLPSPLPRTTSMEEAALPGAEGVHPIVAVGASAGGLEAFIQLLEHITPKTGMSFVLVQHLDPTHESLLTEILARSTTMPVTEVTDGTVVAPDHVYVMPPNVGMKIASGALRLMPRGTSGKVRYPIDDFFSSLALELKDNAIGVVLSGTGSDGANGLATIIAEGGVAFAQDIKSAKFDAMPAAAIASGVDFILPPAAIAAELATLAQNFLTFGSSAQQGNLLQRDELPIDVQKIVGLLRIARGIDFTHYKQPTVLRRIHRRMLMHKLCRVDDYVTYLKAHPAELDSLYEDILIKVTSFFRDPKSFQALREHVFPKLLNDEKAATSIRIWVPGCATGEEAYSIAICLLEALEEAGVSKKIELFATDISESALVQARRGQYDESIKENVSPERLNRFFSKEGSNYRVLSEVRECCVFAKQNVTRDPPFSKLDLISCRNLLIYFAPKIQKQTLAAFHFALNPDGFLSLGSAETIDNTSNLFGVINKNLKIFSKKPAPRGTVIPDFPSNTLDLKIDCDTSLALPHSEVARKVEIKSDADRAILKFVSPSVVINEHFEILQFRGDTSAFLLQPTGEPTTDLLKMCRPGLLAELRTAIRQTVGTDDAVSRDVSLMTVDRQHFGATIDVIPFMDSSTAQRRFVILFTQRGALAGSPSELMVGTTNEIQRLERDLTETKEYLNTIIEKEQATNEELKSASEEILSANEELQSTNEEMATAKEEIQATNEELTTVNQELQNRNQELASANNDLANLFGSVQIPIVMLSANLAVRRFTPLAEKVLNLSQGDLGRSLAEFGSRLKIDGLERLATEVLESLNTKEEDIQDRDGRWYSLRIKPYRTLDNKIDGTIISLVDIDTLKRSFDHLQDAYRYADAIIQTTPSPLLVLDSDLRVVTANQFFCKQFQVNQAETKNARVYDLGNGQWSLPRLRELLEEVLPKNETIENFIVDHNFPNLGRRIMQLSARKLVQRSGEAAKILLTFHDITDERQSEEGARAAKNAAEAANHAKSEFLANMSHEIRTPLGAILGFTELLVSPEQTRAEAMTSATHIRRSIGHLTELIDEILDIAKIEAGKAEFERIRFRLLPELAETCALLQRRAEEKGLAFNVIFNGKIPESIVACPRRLRQILINIGGNALKFTEQGSVSIVVNLRDSGHGDEVPTLCFVVTDTGLGLSMEQQQRLFLPFSQGDSSVTRRFGGTGLGLTLARLLAQALGGDVVLTESEVGKGSIFTITIDPGSLLGVPMISGLTKSALDQSRGLTAEWFSANQRLAGIRVLLAEDWPDNQVLMVHFLAASGAVVDVANNGAEAVEKAQSSDYDIVLMDIQMPILGGYAATKKLRDAGYKKPIVALTAHAMHGEREKCLAAGCTDYISKPVIPSVLISTIANIVRKNSSNH